MEKMEKTDVCGDAFSVALKLLSAVEGGFSNDKNDRGGETKYGISKKAHPEIDIPNVTWEDAARIYYKIYWLPIRADEITKISEEKEYIFREPTSFIAIKLFDIAVHMGVSSAIKKLQRVLNLIFELTSYQSEDNKPLDVDGKFGPKTMERLKFIIESKMFAANTPSTIADLLGMLQLAKYRSIIKLDPSQKKFEKGWLRRAIMFSSDLSDWCEKNIERYEDD